MVLDNAAAVAGISSLLSMLMPLCCYGRLPLSLLVHSTFGGRNQAHLIAVVAWHRFAVEAITINCDEGVTGDRR